MGKTTLLIAFLQEMMVSEERGDVAVLICLSRIDAVKRIAKEVGLDVTDFAVLTRDAEANALSSTPPKAARILFTTQQRVTAYMRGAERFETSRVFHYDGMPREVRACDETMEPGEVITPTNVSPAAPNLE
ncbi:hypothetical protein [Sagittula salina]|uniref:Uncharacterized protein n=1 Tax=Sagittula salina TaxID=2820268 RepID=A0A940S2B2_9RHOB|nr:hypothetical protein [Sagittula salina]MBP0481834.1 hypothetical protein [Sagittula salina]